MRRELPVWAPPLLALQFLTRVPIPALSRLSAEQALAGFQRSAIWFPLVGLVIGVTTAATVLLTEQVWPRVVAVLLALIIEARLTGGLHEDAVADFCDALGGGRDATHVREIMKDSRIGSHGALGLVLAVGLRAALLVSLASTWLLAASIVAAAVFGRLLMVLAMATVPPAPSPHGLASRFRDRVGMSQFALACAIAIPGLVPFAVLAPVAATGASVASLALWYWFRKLLMKRVGGSTGDCLGFLAYAGQLVVLLAASAM